MDENTTNDNDRPLANLAQSERDLGEHPESQIEARTDTPAHVRLRELEDELFGRHAIRINGHVERGIGSPYHKLTAPQESFEDDDAYEQRLRNSRHYAALEQLVKAETKMAHCSAELAKAQAEHEAAMAVVDRMARHVDGERDGRAVE